MHIPALRWLAACLVLSLCACSSLDVRVEPTERSNHVDQRMLFPDVTAGEAKAGAMYEMRAQERFRMPQALDDATPALPADSPRTALAPTTVCVRIVLSAAGDVQRVDPLDDRDECHAGVAAENADLMQAVRERLLQWRFTPAAVCTWPATARLPAEAEGCAGAERIEAVPVSLMYAFTFEIREGKATVRRQAS